MYTLMNANSKIRNNEYEIKDTKKLASHCKKECTTLSIIFQLLNWQKKCRNNPKSQKKLLKPSKIKKAKLPALIATCN